MAELVAHRSHLYVVHRHEGGRYDEVEYPLEGNSQGYCRTADGVGEYLGYQYPADGPPTEHERGAVKHDAHHRYQGGKPCYHVAQRYTEGSDSHPDRTGNEQRLAPPPFYREHGQQREQDVDDTHDDGLHHRIAHTHAFKNTRGEIEHGVDTHRLLEHTQHDADEDNHPAVGKERFGLLVRRSLDIGQDRACLRLSVDAAQHRQGFVITPAEGQVTRRFGNQQHQQGKQPGRYGLADKHQSPAGLDSPGSLAGIQYLVHPPLLP